MNKIEMNKFQTICPSECQQTPCMLGKIICTDPNQLSYLPMNIPKSIFQITIKNQYFSNSTLTYYNLSKYGPEQINLRILELIFTNIDNVEPEAFSHLISLKSLDLSNNRLKVIESGTFKGLSLDFLRLDNNPNIILHEKSLGGLVVSSLSINNCNIKILSYDVIKEVSGHLTKLFLSNNLLKVLDKKFELLFRRLDKMTLDQNPFSCTCQMNWLSKSLQNQEEKNGKYYGNIPQPQCEDPDYLKGRTIISLNDSNFQCSPPSVKELDIYLYRNNSGVLFCEALNNMETYVKWRHKLFTLQKFYRYFDYTQSIGKSMILIKSKASIDHYTCYVQNNKGNVHVDVNIMWPIFNESPSYKNSNTVKYLYPEIQEDSLNVGTGSYIEKLLMSKHFSLFELLVSMAGTMIVTGLISSLCFCFICKKRFAPLISKEAEPMTDSAVTSEVQMHNMSQFPSYQELKPSQLLDFRTQQILPLVGSQSNWSLKI